TPGSFLHTLIIFFLLFSTASSPPVPVVAYTGDAEIGILWIEWKFIINNLSAHFPTIIIFHAYHYFKKEEFVSIFRQKCHEQAWYANHFFVRVISDYFVVHWQATRESHMHFLSQIIFSPFVILLFISSIGGTCPPWDYTGLALSSYTILYTDKVAERDLMPAFEITFCFMNIYT
ncbi:hypothetical protein ACJX0J_022351, partial [Zea mays]